MKVPTNEQKPFFIPTLLALMVIFAASTDRLEAQAVFTWTGNASNSLWNDPGNWNLDSGSSTQNFPGAVGDIGIFGAAVAGVLELDYTAGHNMDAAVNILASANGNISVDLNSAQSQGFQNITIHPDSGLEVFTVTAPAGRNIRMPVGGGTFNVPENKTVNYTAPQFRSAGGAPQMQLTGGGSFDLSVPLIGSINLDDQSYSVNFLINHGTLNLFPGGSGEDLVVMTASSAFSNRQARWTIEENGILSMDVGDLGNVVEFRRATGPGTDEPFQGDWLQIASGATLDLRKTPDFQLNTWYTLFRNVDAPLFDFTVSGLNVGETASFQSFEYATGFFDYQIMVVPEPSSALMLLLGGSGLYFLRRRSRRC